MTKTVILSGTEQVVTGLEKNNTLVVNNSDAPVFASNKPNVEAYADDVIEIPVGARDTVVGTNGTVYVLGTGRVELRGVDYVGFNSPSRSESGGGGGIVLEPATETKLGGVKIGDGLNVEMDGKVSAPLATETKIVEIMENRTASSSEINELMSLIFNT